MRQRVPGLSHPRRSLSHCRRCRSNCWLLEVVRVDAEPLDPALNLLAVLSEIARDCVTFVSAMTSYVILFLIYFSISFTKYFSGPAEIIIRQLSTWSHLQNFAVGIITVGDVVYYLNGILICIVLTRLSIENRW